MLQTFESVTDPSLSAIRNKMATGYKARCSVTDPSLSAIRNHRARRRTS